MPAPREIAVVIPCYRVSQQICELIGKIGPEVSYIFVVDDACPDKSGHRVQQEIRDSRVKVLFNQENLGVGGATKRGYQAALETDAKIVIKLDGDGQMDPGFIPVLIAPLLGKQADYTKGNRFFNYEDLRPMPAQRLIGNALLSFFTKASSGYWNIFDPNNGYTAINASALRILPLDKISDGYFFESDMLFRLNCIRAVVVDVPMKARYGNEESQLRIARIILPFASKHMKNLAKRILYNYFIRDFTVVSLELFAGLLFFLFGISYGTYHWAQSILYGSYAAGGVIMLAAITIIIGVQLIISALNYDIYNTPRNPLCRLGLDP